MSRRPTRLLIAAPFAFVLALAFLWRMPVAPREWRYMLCENDSLYQLYRVQECLADYPRVPSVDPFSHYPAGYRVHWLALHSVFYATLARLAGIGAADRTGLVAFLSWIPPLLGVLAVAAAMAVAACFRRSLPFVLAVGILCALSVETTRPFFFGVIDHHLFAHLGVLLLVWGRLAGRRALWAAGLVSLLAMTPESIIYVSALVGVAFCADAAGLALRPQAAEGEAASGTAEWFWYASPAAIALGVWVLQRSLETAPLPTTSFSWTDPTLFQPSWLALWGIGLGAVLASWKSAPLVRPVPRRALGMLALVGLAGAAFFAATGSLMTIASRLTRSGRMFVAEEASVFSRGLGATPPWYWIVVAAGFVIAAVLLQALRSRRRPRLWFGWMALLLAVALGCLEYRHLYVLSSLQMLAVVAAAWESVDWLRRRAPAGRTALSSAAAVVAVLVIGAVFARGDVLHRAARHAQACGNLAVVEELADWLKTSTPSPRTAGAEPAYGVFTPWNIGHQIHILGDRPVIVDPFNYETDSSVEDTLAQVWLAKTADELAAALRRHRARYLVLTNPAEEIAGVLRRRGGDVHRFVRIEANGAPTYLPPMLQFAAFRLYMTRGAAPEFAAFTPRFLAPQTETYTANAGEKIEVPLGQVYEIE